MKKTITVLTALALVFILVLPVFASGDGIGFSEGDAAVLYAEGDNDAVDQEEIDAMTDFTLSRYVVDDADLLSDREEENLAQFFAAIEKKRECSVIAVTMDYVSGDIEAFTDDYYDNGGFGFGKDHTGVMMLLDMSDREWHITTTGEALIYDIQPYIDDIAEAFVDGLNGNDDFFSGFYTFGKYVDHLLGNDFEPIAEPDYEEVIALWQADARKAERRGTVAFGLSLPAFIVVSLIAGLILSLLTVSSMKKKNKSVRFSSTADYYQKNGTFTLSRQNERFLFFNVTRTKIAQENNNRGGGFSSSGGGIHTGSSGTSHGGGSGHF